VVSLQSNRAEDVGLEITALLGIEILTMTFYGCFLSRSPRKMHLFMLADVDSEKVDKED
jgi:hypothetical protein